MTSTEQASTVPRSTANTATATGRTRADAMLSVQSPGHTSEEVFERFRSRNTRMYIATALVAVAMGGLSASSVLGALIVIPSIAVSVLLVSLSFGVSFDRTRLHRPLLYTALALGLATLVATALMQNNIAGSTGLAFAAGIAIAALPERRKTTLLFAALAVAAVSSLTFLVESDAQWRTLMMLTVFFGVWSWAVVDVEEQYFLLRMIERAKEAESEASLLRERSRIAADLHDIQGHTLHVIKLKAAVAARVQATDPQRTADELANAVRLFEAAGIDVAVSGAELVDPGWQAEAAIVLREATTNILRHARASCVEIVAGARSIEVRNDGVVDEPREFRGLATLGERLRGSGASFSAGAQHHAVGSWFVVRAEA